MKCETPWRRCRGTTSWKQAPTLPARVLLVASGFGVSDYCFCLRWTASHSLGHTASLRFGLEDGGDRRHLHTCYAFEGDESQLAQEIITVGTNPSPVINRYAKISN